MTIKEWAEKLDGREYGEETTKDENKQMADEGVVAVFGCSDDLLEFQGAVDGVLEAWEGVDAYLGKTGEGKISVVTQRDLEELNRNLRELEENITMLIDIVIKRMVVINAFWNPDNLKTLWLIETDIPHETFDIMEDGELFCRGIVFHVDSIPVVV